MQHFLACYTCVGSTYPNIYCMFAFEREMEMCCTRPREGVVLYHAPSYTLPILGPGSGVQRGSWFGQGRIRMKAPLRAAGQTGGSPVRPAAWSQAGDTFASFITKGVPSAP